MMRHVRMRLALQKNGIRLAVCAFVAFSFLHYTFSSPSRENAPACNNDAFLLPINSTNFYHFPPSSTGYALAPQSLPLQAKYLPFLLSTPSSTHLPTVSKGARPSLQCVEARIAKGEDHPSCATDHSQDAPIDILWTYVNGSDPLSLVAHRSALEATAPSLPQGPKKQYVGLLREFDELRYSIRSVLENFKSSPGGNFHIVASDFAVPSCQQEYQIDSGSVPDRHWRLGQIPQWLEYPSFGDPGTWNWKDGEVNLRFIHHTNLFGKGHRGFTFNSLAIESRFGNLKDVSENFVYMNDDIFFADKMTSNDFFSPVFGPVFRMQPSLLIHSLKPPIGEWASLVYTNELLDQRFGARGRPYLTHIAKSLTLPTLREVSAAWSFELETTAFNHTFRGGRDAPDVSLTLLATHYHIERWREALLWSWIVGRIGGIDDEWGTDQTNQAWKELGGDNAQHASLVTVISTQRDTLTSSRDSAHRPTLYTFSSFDGYPFNRMGRSGFETFPNVSDSEAIRQHLGSRCTISKAECFGSMLSSATEVFKNIAFRKVLCGDCIVSALVLASGRRGLSAFLPEPSRLIPAVQDEDIQASEAQWILPVSNRWTDENFTVQNTLRKSRTSSPREFALQMLYRYRFVIGDTPSLFVRLRNPKLLELTLSKLNDTVNKPSVLCLNDDVIMNDTVVGDSLKNWMEKTWPRPARWEIPHP